MDDRQEEAGRETTAGLTNDLEALTFNACHDRFTCFQYLGLVVADSYLDMIPPSVNSDFCNVRNNYLICDQLLAHRPRLQVKRRLFLSLKAVIFGVDCTGLYSKECCYIPWNSESGPVDATTEPVWEIVWNAYAYAAERGRG